MQGLADESVALELAVSFCAEKVRTFLLLVAQNADVALRTDSERLEELRRDGFDRRVGRVWGRNDCMADSLLQLLIAHGRTSRMLSGMQRVRPTAASSCTATYRIVVRVI